MININTEQTISIYMYFLNKNTSTLKELGEWREFLSSELNNKIIEKVKVNMDKQDISYDVEEGFIRLRDDHVITISNDPKAMYRDIMSFMPIKAVLEVGNIASKYKQILLQKENNENISEL